MVRSSLLAALAWAALASPLAAPLSAPLSAQAPEAIAEVANRIIAAAQADSAGAWNRIAELTDRFGHRLSGSKALEDAILWTAATMEKDGLANVKREKVMVPHWVRGAESLELVAPRRQLLPMLGLGGSIATPAAGITAEVMVVASFVPLPFSLVLGVALLLGGIINPLYSLLIALTNDYLSKEDMPGASAGLIFLNGFGAIFGPLVSGWFMAQIGAGGYFLFLGLLFAALAGYAAWRISRRSGPVEQASFTGLSPTASSLAVGAVMEQEPRTRRAG